MRHLAKPLADALNRDANEADTRLLVTDVLRDGLGYHEYGDLATEYRVRGEYADYGIEVLRPQLRGRSFNLDEGG